MMELLFYCCCGQGIFFLLFLDVASLSMMWHLCQVSLSDARLLRRPYASTHCHSANRGGFDESMEQHDKPSSALKDDHTHSSFITGHVFSPSPLYIIKPNKSNLIPASTRLGNVSDSSYPCYSNKTTNRCACIYFMFLLLQPKKKTGDEKEERA